MQVLMMSKRVFLIMIVIIKKGENVNHADFDDAKKSLLDNDCHHQKGGECECMNMKLLMMPKMKAISRLKSRS